jgi:hypothetical protein
MDDEPPQGALFQIEGPDEPGCVWICGIKWRDHWCANHGPAEKAPELMSRWVGQIEYDGRTRKLAADA